MFERFIGVIGLFVLILIAYVFSNNRKSVDRSLVIKALITQFVLALLVLGVPALNIHGPFQTLFVKMNDIILATLDFTLEGSKFIFGDLVDVKKSGFILAFRVLPTIIFMSSLMAILYYLGVMQKIVNAIAWLMQKIMNISGAESLSVAANIFVGQTEAPLIIRPFIKRMTQSELLAVMTGGMATVAGGVLAVYVDLLREAIPNIAGHLLTASVMSAPAALAAAKIIYPETEVPETLGKIPSHVAETKDHNLIEAAARGAGEGLKLALNVAAMLLAFIALIAMFDAILRHLGEWILFAEWGSGVVPDAILSKTAHPELSLSLILGWIFMPLAYLMGIPFAEAGIAGSLLGQKIVLNEFFAYMELSKIMHELSPRTVIILSYALCGFANFSSIAIQIGGIGGIAPSRQGDLARLGLRSVIGGSIAAFMTATIAGLLL